MVWLRQLPLRRRRDLPRTAAPLLFGLFNIASGLTGLHNEHYHVAAYTRAAQFMPLDDWAFGFICLGVLILLGPAHRVLAWTSSLTATFYWFAWASFISQTVGQTGVTPRAVVTTGGLAVLHTLLVPYRRRQAVARCDGR